MLGLEEILTVQSVLNFQNCSLFKGFKYAPDKKRLENSLYLWTYPFSLYHINKSLRIRDDFKSRLYHLLEGQICLQKLELSEAICKMGTVIPILQGFCGF